MKLFAILCFIVGGVAQPPNGFVVLTDSAITTMIERDGAFYWKVHQTLVIKVIKKEGNEDPISRIMSARHHSESNRISKIQVDVNGEDQTDDILKSNRIVDNLNESTEAKIFYLDLDDIDDGDIVRLKHESESMKDKHIQSFFFQNDLAEIKRAALTIRIPKNHANAFYHRFYGYTTQPKLNRSETSDHMIYDIRFSNVEMYEPEAITDRLSKRISYGYLETDWSKALTFRDYQSQIENCYNDTATAAKIVDRLGLDKLKPLDQIKTLYRYVQSNFKYAYIDMHEHGYIPSDLELILTQRKADCKDYTSLMHNIFKYLGIESHPIIMAVRERGSTPYDPNLKFIGSYDHAYLEVIHDKQRYYLDGTGQKFNIDEIRSDIQGQLAMRHLYRQKTAEIFKMPESQASTNMLTYTVTGTVQKNRSLTARIDAVYTGSLSFRGRDMLRILPIKDVREQMEKTLKRHNPYLIIDSLIIQTQDPFDPLFKVTYFVHHNSYVEDLGGLNGIPINFLSVIDYQFYQDTDRKTGYLFSNPPHAVNVNVDIKLPTFKVDYLPETTQKATDDVAFNYTVSPSKRSLKYSYQTTFKNRHIPFSKVGSVRTVMKHARDASQEYFTFTWK